MQVMHAALGPTDDALRRSEVEVIYSCFKLEYYKAWREWQTLLTTIIHLFSFLH